MQRHLIRPEPYAPLPNSTGCYVPVLQDHPGERTALANASPQAWSQMTPLIEIVPHGGAMSHNAIKQRMRKLKDTINDHPIYMDIKKLDPCASTQTPQGERPVLEIMHEVARSRELAFMPVAWTNSNDSHLRVVTDTSDLDGHGIALRHRVGTTVMPTGHTMETLLAKRLEELQISASDIDLLIDLEHLEPDSEPSMRWVAGLLEQSARAGTWRSVVLIATSVPSSFGNGLVPQHTTRELPRREWMLWKNVVQRTKMAVAYGDYGVQNPIPPPNPPPIGPWANIRYSIEEALFVARGLDIRTYGPEQYTELSSWVASHPSFRGPNFSYGDAEILRWSAKTSSVGLADYSEEDEEIDNASKPAGLSYWRGVGTSHHLELVTEQLRQHSR